MRRASSEDGQAVGLAELGETLSGLRLCTEETLGQMRQSLLRHGQLTPVAAYVSAAGSLELVDGFKRLRAARELSWAELRVRLLAVDAVQAKLALRLLNSGPGLSEIEEAWLCRSLYREDHLSQPEIGRLLSRHKSWVCRRLLLAEGLDEALQADVRLGLLCARSACALSRLPRDNQAEVALLVVRYGLTLHQTERLVSALCACADETARQAILAEERLRPQRPPARSSSPRAAALRSPAEAMLADACALGRLVARLQARLLAAPLAALGEPRASLVAETLVALVPALASLQLRITSLSRKDLVHALEQPRGACPAVGHPGPPGAEPPGHCPGARGQSQHGGQDPAPPPARS